MPIVTHTEVNPERQWAVGLSQDDFKREYCRRFPHGSDSVPDVNKWIYRENTKCFGIDGVNPEDYQTQEGKQEPQKSEEQIKDECKRVCRGCGREFPAMNVKGQWRVPTLAWTNHERHCKAILNKKI